VMVLSLCYCYSCCYCSVALSVCADFDDARMAASIDDSYS
jgi:hypothetical protein